MKQHIYLLLCASMIMLCCPRSDVAAKKGPNKSVDAVRTEFLELILQKKFDDASTLYQQYESLPAYRAQLSSHIRALTSAGIISENDRQSVVANMIKKGRQPATGPVTTGPVTTGQNPIALVIKDAGDKIAAYDSFLSTIATNLKNITLNQNTFTDLQNTLQKTKSTDTAQQQLITDLSTTVEEKLKALKSYASIHDLLTMANELEKKATINADDQLVNNFNNLFIQLKRVLPLTNIPTQLISMVQDANDNFLKNMVQPLLNATIDTTNKDAIITGISTWVSNLSSEATKSNQTIVAALEQKHNDAKKFGAPQKPMGNLPPIPGNIPTAPPLPPVTQPAAAFDAKKIADLIKEAKDTIDYYAANKSDTANSDSVTAYIKIFTELQVKLKDALTIKGLPGSSWNEITDFNKEITQIINDLNKYKNIHKALADIAALQAKTSLNPDKKLVDSFNNLFHEIDVIVQNSTVNKLPMALGALASDSRDEFLVNMVKPLLDAGISETNKDAIIIGITTWLTNLSTDAKDFYKKSALETLQQKFDAADALNLPKKISTALIKHIDTTISDLQSKANTLVPARATVAKIEGALKSVLKKELDYIAKITQIDQKELQKITQPQSEKIEKAITAKMNDLKNAIKTAESIPLIEINEGLAQPMEKIIQEIDPTGKYYVDQSARNKYPSNLFSPYMHIDKRMETASLYLLNLIELAKNDVKGVEYLARAVDKLTSPSTSKDSLTDAEANEFNMAESRFIKENRKAVKEYQTDLSLAINALEKMYIKKLEEVSAMIDKHRNIMGGLFGQFKAIDEKDYKEIRNAFDTAVRQMVSTDIHKLITKPDAVKSLKEILERSQVTIKKISDDLEALEKTIKKGSAPSKAPLAPPTPQEIAQALKAEIDSAVANLKAKKSDAVSNAEAIVTKVNDSNIAVKLAIDQAAFDEIKNLIAAAKAPAAAKAGPAPVGTPGAVINISAEAKNNLAKMKDAASAIAIIEELPESISVDDANAYKAKIDEFITKAADFMTKMSLGKARTTIDDNTQILDVD